MKYSLYIGKEPNLQKIVIISAVLHILFMSLAVIPIKSREREFRSYQVKLVGPIRAGTPGAGRGQPTVKKKRTLPPKKVSRKVPPKKIVKTPAKADMSLERTEKVAREIERIRAISALSKKKKQKAREVEVVRKEEREEGAGGTGMPGKESGTDLHSYYALITEKIWSQWVYPHFDSRELETVMSITIDREGKIISQEIEKSSGNRLFDRSVVKALSKASPLPPPPEEMEIGVKFYL